jgi:hypothetical protein
MIRIQKTGYRRYNSREIDFFVTSILLSPEY